MLNRNLIYSVLVALALFTSCCKDNNSVSPNLYTNYKMPHEMLDYGYFKPGSYWIYEDTVSGALDSVWVYDAYYQIDTLPEGNSNYLNPGIYDYFQIKTTSSHFNADYYYWCNSSRVTSDNFYQMRREKIMLGNVRENIVFIYPLQIGKELGLSGNIISVSNVITLYTIDSAIFTDVAIINQTGDQTEDDNPTTFYISKGVGIIKKEISNRNEYWQLIRYNLSQ